jgi:hypothetical protein
MGGRGVIWLPFFGVLCLVSSRAQADGTPSAKGLDFNRDIRPILSDNCYACHGPDDRARKARLRLDTPAGAFAKLRAGGYAIVPGKSGASELVVRVTAEDPAEQMPPPKSGKKLTPAQIDLLRRWIEQGAKWSEHWAFVSPRRAPLPPVKDTAWPRNAIDHFVLARLEQEGLRPSPEADRATLLRRLSLDLTGLPLTPAELDAFLADPSPGAYERVVDRLLASPAYGERMAQRWLDLARYGDTNGYRLDNHRDVWKWREWVIEAYNRNLPFDQFTVEQLAGDLLPGATLSQKVATGFHRNTMVNFGNGSDPKEYLHKAVADRAVTTAAVWLGLTLGCAQCHDHRYDPFTQKDFYRLYAFFNNVPEKGLDGEKTNPVPSIRLPSPEQAGRLAAVRRDLARAEARLAAVKGDADKQPALQQEQARLRKAEEGLLAEIPAALVMEEMSTPRATHVLVRGDYLSEGEAVTAGVPAVLPPLPPGAPTNRLGLARWLTDPTNPLASRVTVNRLWEAFFGIGLVKTAEDFGSQGEPPSHPELLDWLAVEFRTSGWDVKAIQRLMVLSATYRQSSNVNRDLQERDPHNRLLARASRFRLDAETVRDNALAVGGLLDRRLGGPSVYPWQPPGLWEQVAVGGAYTSQVYVPSRGRDLCRRGLYTYRKRTAPHPALAAFDGPSGEACTVRRERTTTPLQALVLLNDPSFVEAAGALARRVLREGGKDTATRLAFAFRLCTGRVPRADELRVLARVHEEQRTLYLQDRPAARALAGAGAAGGQVGADEAELATWTAVATLLLNLDETITRE